MNFEADECDANVTRPNPEKSVTFVTFEFQTPTRVPQIHLCSDAQKTLILLAYGGYLTRLSRQLGNEVIGSPAVFRRNFKPFCLPAESARWRSRREFSKAKSGLFLRELNKTDNIVLKIKSDQHHYTNIIWKKRKTSQLGIKSKCGEKRKN